MIIEENDIETISILVKRDKSFKPVFLEKIVATNKYKMLKYLIDLGIEFTSHHLEIASECNSRDVINELLDRNIRHTKVAKWAIVHNNNIEILKRVVKEYDIQDLLVLSAKYERLSSFRLLYTLSDNIEISRDSLNNIVNSGYIPILDFLKSRIDLTEYVNVKLCVNPLYSYIVYCHKTDVLQVTLDKEIFNSNNNLRLAISAGDRRLVSTLKEILYRIKDCGSLAIESGNLDVLKYLVEEKICKPSKAHYALAINYSYLDILNYLDETFNKEINIIIGNNVKDVAMISYLSRKGCHTSIRNRYHLNSAALKYLYYRGYVRLDNINVEEAIRNRKYKIIDFLLNNGVHLNERCCPMAIQNDDLEMVKYLRSKGCSWGELLCKVYSFSMFKYLYHQKAYPLNIEHRVDIIDLVEHHDKNKFLKKLYNEEDNYTLWLSNDLLKSILAKELDYNAAFNKLFGGSNF